MLRNTRTTAFQLKESLTLTASYVATGVTPPYFLSPRFPGRGPQTRKDKKKKKYSL